MCDSRGGGLVNWRVKPPRSGLDRTKPQRLSPTFNNSNGYVYRSQVQATVSELGGEWPLGLIVAVKRDPESALEKVDRLGLPTCEILTEDFDDAMADRLVRGLQSYGIKATALFSLGPGRMVWDFYEGPLTIGLVPRETRWARIKSLKRASDFAKRCGIPAVHTHCGFIPENPSEALYKETVIAIREVAGHCKSNGQIFLYHTGQETPVTLLRTIEDVGLGNQAVGLDTANFVLYGKANPVDALDVLGPRVRAMHAKDGFYPTDPRKLGREVPIGQGRVDFRTFFQRLRELGYAGAVTIEREISGPQQIEDVRQSAIYLHKLM
jgi:L-ribulose-5-phosphate 3-epimerase